MGKRKVSFTPGEYYHIYNRGNSKQDIFKDDHDRKRFQTLLFVANGVTPYVVREIQKDDIFEFEKGEPLVHIEAYCLMPNHFHILLSPISENGVQNFMQKLSTGYSMYFNRRHGRSGSLFEGRFKSQHVFDDRYLKYLFSYIHLNPVKLLQPDWRVVGISDVEKARSYLLTYKHSSLLDYLTEREESAVISPNLFVEHFPTKEAIWDELFDWLKYNDSEPGQNHLTEARPL